MACVHDACKGHFNPQLEERSCENCYDYIQCIFNPSLEVCENRKICQHCTMAVGCKEDMFVLATDWDVANAYYQGMKYICQKLNFSQKSKFLSKNRNFCQKLNFFSKIKISIKNRNFCQKLKLL